MPNTNIKELYLLEKADSVARKSEVNKKEDRCIFSNGY
jgi:hypothetical protein